MPALAKQVAMPLAHGAGTDRWPPARSAAPACPWPTPGTLRAARSAKNTWRSAADSGEAMQSSKISHAPCGFPRRRGASAPPRRIRGRPPARAGPAPAVARRSRVAANTSGILENGGTVAGERVRRPCGECVLAANASAPSRKSPSITRSRIPVLGRVRSSKRGCRRRSSRAPWLDVPRARGRRWVPPAPGGKPSEHLRLADLGIPARDAIVAGERHFEPAAEAVAG